MSKNRQKNPQPKNSRNIEKNIEKESFGKKRRHYSFGFLAGDY